MTIKYYFQDLWELFLLNAVFKPFGCMPKIKKYGHIFSLGYNCEVSFQFFKYHHFVESGLFSWVNALDIKTLTKALNNFDTIASGDFEYDGKMWRCLKSSIYFHGKRDVKSTDIQALNADKEELKPRLDYLKNKFLTTGTDGKKNLYIYKHSVRDSFDKETFVKDVQNLYDTLKKLIRNEFDLLIVTENKTFSSLSEADFSNNHIYWRSIIFFTPENNVTTKENDKRHWRQIFREFRPDFKLPQTKKYKFEEVANV